MLFMCEEWLECGHVGLWCDDDAVVVGGGCGGVVGWFGGDGCLHFVGDGHGGAAWLGLAGCEVYEDVEDALVILESGCESVGAGGCGWCGGLGVLGCGLCGVEWLWCWCEGDGCGEVDGGGVGGGEVDGVDVCSEGVGECCGDV